MNYRYFLFFVIGVGVAVSTVAYAQSDSIWETFNNTGVRLATTTNQVIIGASATSTNNAFEVAGSGIFLDDLTVKDSNPNTEEIPSLKLGNDDFGLNAVGQRLVFISQGSVILRLDDDQIQTAGLGTLNEPDITLADSNTGIWHGAEFDAWAGVADGFEFFRLRGSASGQKEFILNESSNDIDFRVETNNSTHSFFVEGSSGRIGVGTSSPSAKLTVDGDGLFSEGVDISNGCYAVNGICVKSTAYITLSTSKISDSSTAYTPVGFAVFGGVNMFNSPTYKSIVNLTSVPAGGLSLRLRDVTNNLTIWEIAGISSSGIQEISNANHSNVPTNNAVLELQAKKDSGGGTWEVAGGTLIISN